MAFWVRGGGNWPLDLSGGLGEQLRRPVYYESQGEHEAGPQHTMAPALDSEQRLSGDSGFAEQQRGHGRLSPWGMPDGLPNDIPECDIPYPSVERGCAPTPAPAPAPETHVFFILHEEALGGAAEHESARLSLSSPSPVPTLPRRWTNGSDLKATEALARGERAWPPDDYERAPHGPYTPYESAKTVASLTPLSLSQPPQRYEAWRDLQWPHYDEDVTADPDEGDARSFSPFVAAPVSSSQLLPGRRPSPTPALAPFSSRRWHGMGPAARYDEHDRYEHSRYEHNHDDHDEYSRTGQRGLHNQQSQHHRNHLYYHGQPAEEARACSRPVRSPRHNPPYNPPHSPHDPDSHETLMTDAEAAASVAAHLANFHRRHPSSRHERILLGLIHPKCPADAEFELDDRALESIFSSANALFFNGRLTQRVQWDWSDASSHPEYDSKIIGHTSLRQRAAAGSRGVCCGDSSDSGGGGNSSSSSTRGSNPGSTAANANSGDGGSGGGGGGGGFETFVLLSAPILKNRAYSRRLLISAFLHELIHCYLFICCGWAARADGGHTEGFRRIADTIDRWAGRERLYLCHVEADLEHFRQPADGPALSSSSSAAAAAAAAAAASCTSSSLALPSAAVSASSASSSTVSASASAFSAAYSSYSLSSPVFYDDRVCCPTPTNSDWERRLHDRWDHHRQTPWL